MSRKVSATKKSFCIRCTTYFVHKSKSQYAVNYFYSWQASLSVAAAEFTKLLCFSKKDTLQWYEFCVPRHKSVCRFSALFRKRCFTISELCIMFKSSYTGDTNEEWSRHLSTPTSEEGIEQVCAIILDNLWETVIEIVILCTSVLVLLMKSFITNVGFIKFVQDAVRIHHFTEQNMKEAMDTWLAIQTNLFLKAYRNL